MLVKRSVIFALLVCVALATPCMAKSGQPGAEAAIQALVEQHNKALGAHDLKGIMDTYGTGPGVVLMGTGPGEAYVGDEAIGNAYNQFFSRFEPETLNFKYDWIATGSKGDVAWFALTATAQAMVKNEKMERVFNMTGTLEKVKGKWRFVCLHFSKLGAEQQEAQQSQGAPPEGSQQPK